MNKILIWTIRLYKKYATPVLSRTFGNACRFTPTCSEYTIEALEKYGFIKGLFMGLKRISKCRPFGGYGFDPVK